MAQFFQLDQRQSGVDIGKVVLEARGDHLRLRRAAVGLTIIGVHAQTMEFQTADTGGQLVVVGDNQPAFGAGHVFDRVERENGGPLPAHVAAFIMGTGRMGGVFDHRNAMALAHRANGVDVGWRARVVHGNYRFGTRSDRRFHRCRGNHQIVVIDIDHHRRGAQQADHIESGDPGLGRRNDFIAGANTQRHQGHMHPAGR